MNDTMFREQLRRDGYAEYDILVAEAKRAIITSTLIACGYNRTQAARVLGINRTFIAKLMRRLGIEAPRPERVTYARYSRRRAGPSVATLAREEG